MEDTPSCLTYQGPSGKKSGRHSRHRLTDKGRGKDGWTFAHTWSQTHVDPHTQAWTRAPTCMFILLLRGTQPTLDSECPGDRAGAGAGRPEGETQIHKVPQKDAQVEHRHTWKEGDTPLLVLSLAESWLEELVPKSHWRNRRRC